MRTKPIDEYRLALREELDVHSFISQRRITIEGVDAHFFGLSWNLDGTETPIRVSDYWKGPLNPNLDGELKCPKSVREIKILSRRAYDYPHLSIGTKLPTLPVDGTQVEFGFENDASRGTGTVELIYRRTGGVSRLMFYMGGFSGTTAYLDLDWAKPADAEASIHNYGFKASRPFFEIYIDGRLRLICVDSPLVGLLVNGPPYSIASYDRPISRTLCVHLEAYSLGIADVIFPLNPINVYMGDGDPIPPRVFRLYVAGTETPFAGSSLSSGTLTSHPVPVFGYRDKTLYFQANKDSTPNGLVVEVLTQSGNWRTYDAETYSADKFWTYKADADALLMRLSYTPSSYPASVSEGEVIMA